MDQQVTHGTNLIHFKNKCIHYWIIFYLQDLLCAVFERDLMWLFHCFLAGSLHPLHFNITTILFLFLFLLLLLHSDFSNICHSVLRSRLWRLIRSWGFFSPPVFVKVFFFSPSILFMKSMNSVFLEREMAFRNWEVGDPLGAIWIF